MAENREEGVGIDISPVVAEYERWEERGKKLAIDQALHPAVLNSIPWEKDTPGKIAEFALQVAKNEVLWWADDRRDHYWSEKDKSYDKAREVRREIRKILRKEKGNNNATI